MEYATRITIETLLRNDPSVDDEQQQRYTRELRRERGQDRMLTTREACETLDLNHPVHPITLRRYEKAGKLSAVRHSPRRIRWRESEIIALREGRVA